MLTSYLGVRILMAISVAALAAVLMRTGRFVAGLLSKNVRPSARAAVSRNRAA